MPQACNFVKKKLWYRLTVCSYHVKHEFRSEFTPCICMNIKKLLTRNRRDIWSLSDCNGFQTAKLAKMIESCCSHSDTDVFLWIWRNFFKTSFLQNTLGQLLLFQYQFVLLHIIIKRFTKVLQTKVLKRAFIGCSSDIASSCFFRSNKVWSVLHHGSVGASSE